MKIKSLEDRVVIKPEMIEEKGSMHRLNNSKTSLNPV